MSSLQKTDFMSLCYISVEEASLFTSLYSQYYAKQASLDIYVIYENSNSSFHCKKK